MPQRLDLPEFVGGGGPQLGAPLWGLNELMSAPGLAPITGTGLPNLSVDDGAYKKSLMLGQEGMPENFFLTPWEELWSPTGQLTNPFALLQYLNIANVMSPEAAPNYMRDPSGYSSASSWTTDQGGEIWDPAGYGTSIGSEQYGGGDWSDALQTWLYNMSFRGQQDPSGWFEGDKPHSPALFYDPSMLRYTQLPENYTMWGADEWNQWAKGEGANNLWDLASRPADLLATEAAWRQDPSLWYNAAAPAKPIGILGEGSGLGTALGTSRMQQFANQLEEWENRQAQIGALGPEMFMSYASRNDPAFARSQLGRYHGMTAPGMGQWANLMGGYAPESADYSYLIQSAMQPYLMQNQLNAYLNSQGMNI